MKQVIGLMLVDAPSSALNNAGLQPGERTENVVRTKVIQRGREFYPYVSGQAIRYWWRTTLKEKFGWKLSPLTREKTIVFSEANPIEYPDDDVFGYMRAPKGSEKAALTRLSPLKVSPLISIIPQAPVMDFGVASRHEGDPVPYEHEFYSTVLKGIFSLDITRVGLFSAVNKSGYKNLNNELEELAKVRGLIKTEDGCWQLNREERKKRIRDTLEALPYLFGGAMSARHLTDVTPKLLILAVVDGGNHPFVTLVNGEDGRAKISMRALEQVIKDYESQFLTPVFIGRREGFMDEFHNDLVVISQKLEGKLVYGSINEMIGDFVPRIDELLD